MDSKKNNSRDFRLGHVGDSISETIVKLRLGSGTQAQSGSVRLKLRLSDSGSVTQAQWQWQGLRAWADTKIL